MKYFVDSGRTDYHICKDKVSALRVNEFELEIINRMREKINSLTIQKMRTDIKTDNKLIELSAEKEKVQTEIDNLVDTLTTTQNQTTILYSKKNEIEMQIETVRREQQNAQNVHEQLKDVMSKWNYLSFDDKRSVTMLLIHKIKVFKDHVEIIWNV